MYEMSYHERLYDLTKVPLSGATDAAQAPVGLISYPTGPSPLQAGLVLYDIVL
jgi:hypothetical protein